jgi:galactoside O-acetyltransferase
MAFYSDEMLQTLRFKKLGKHVQISDKASFYNPESIEIGDYSRIDDFCVLSAGDAGIMVGRYVHIAVNCSLVGAARIELHDYSGLSSRVAIYTSNEDYSGKFMTNPTVPAEYKRVTNEPVILERHVIVGTGAVLLPGITLHEGCCVGALSLVKKDCESFGIYLGVPAKRIGRRSNELLEHERRLIAAGGGQST